MNGVDELFKGKEEDTPIITRKHACTVVSLLPVELNEPKPQMLPAMYKVEAAEYGSFSILHVEEAICYIPNPFDDRSIKQTTSANEMARSICEDYVSASIALGEDAQPGLFWVDGRLTKSEVSKYHGNKLARVKRAQDNWFRHLIAMADADWQKNHNMLAVSDLQRIAARCLGVHKDWVDFTPLETVICPFCKASIAPDSVKCFNCKEVVNQKLYDSMVSKREEKK